MTLFRWPNAYLMLIKFTDWIAPGYTNKFSIIITFNCMAIENKYEFRMMSHRFSVRVYFTISKANAE